MSLGDVTIFFVNMVLIDYFFRYLLHFLSKSTDVFTLLGLSDVYYLLQIYIFRDLRIYLIRRINKIFIKICNYLIYNIL